ncbi:hypothetical protein [Clostridium guangxiense]|uniref:hypothetical protein n=1 Tax=Clostridium guangxiense TaxID=1662055 RepID=UPI001E424D70|nr:hypothetical protein [Clostridium guangxiense]MCD2347837.1 hypothetical protein [Clostridium guangxiense]
MLKLIKYEIKTVWRDLIILLAIVVLLNLALLTRVNVWKNDLVFGLSCLIYFGGLVAIFIGNIKIFTRDLKENTGYLLFTLPQNGYSIVGEKLIISLVEVIIISTAGIGFIDVFSSLVSLQLFKGFNFGAVLQTVGDLYAYISLIIFIYFVVAVTKMIMKGRRLSGLVEFGIFGILAFVSYKIDVILEKIFPQKINISGGITNLQISPDKVSNVSYGSVSFNIANGVFGFIVTVILFVVTARILEKRIDL